MQRKAEALMLGSLLRLAISSLWNRRLSAGLTVLSIGLGLALLLTIERVRDGAREGFSQTVSGTDLLVGSRTGGISLLLYSVFHIGNATNNISIESYNDFAKHPSVAWALPISLGDSHKGFRVIATNEDFFKHFQFRGGNALHLRSGAWLSPKSAGEVVLGATVAKALRYSLQEKIALQHGTSQKAIFEHTDHPFSVIGILEPTQTPIDRAVFISLESMEAIHVGWENGVPSAATTSAGGTDTSSTTAASLEHLAPKQITSFFVGLKNRIDILRVQREINTYKEEPLTAIVPALTLQELWSGIGYAEVALQAVSWIVLLVSLLGMLITLYTQLRERRREFAILRAVGLHSEGILFLFMLETFVLSALGCLFGVALLYGGLLGSREWLDSLIGFSLPVTFLGAKEFMFIGLTLVLGVILGLVVGVSALRKSLADGLQIRV